MTNEQLRAMARRVLELVLEPERCSDGEMRFYPRTETTGVPCAYAIDAVVAILREELGKWPECPKCKKDVPVWTTSKGECDCGMRYENGRFSDDHITHAAVTCCCAIADDPTQTIVIDT